ncbi:hypothetical protein Tco_0620458 [Tanacetum coccineum]
MDEVTQEKEATEHSDDVKNQFKAESLLVDVHTYLDDPLMPTLEDNAEPQDELKKITQALDDESWVEAMKEELLSFEVLT